MGGALAVRVNKPRRRIKKFCITKSFRWTDDGDGSLGKCFDYLTASYDKTNCNYKRTLFLYGP